jgi:hypothetical protein
LCAEVFKEEDELKHTTHKGKYILKFKVYRVVNIKITIFVGLVPLGL